LEYMPRNPFPKAAKLLIRMTPEQRELIGTEAKRKRLPTSTWALGVLVRSVQRATRKKEG
jgi:hypothetical protein